MRLKLALAFSLAAVMLTSIGGALMNGKISLAASTSAPRTSFIGTWRTTWKNVDGRTGSAPVIVKTDSSGANALDGLVEMEGPDEVMSGKLSTDGKTWSGDWWNAKGEKGTFKFTLTGNARFEGSYTIEGHDGNFSWNGTR